MILIYDTETTGLPNYRAPSDHPTQPHLVQLAMLLTSDQGQEIGTINCIIRPDGWTIPDEVADIHGITTEIAMKSGIPEGVATSLYLGWLERSTRRVAHNEGFDHRIMRTALLRAGMDRLEIDNRHIGLVSDTMHISSPIVNLPPTERMIAAGFTKPKAPKLAECIRYFFDEPLDGAHDALVDVRACARLFFHLKTLGAIR